MPTRLTRAKLLRAVAAETGVSPGVVRRVFDSLEGGILAAVAEGREVQLYGLGRFYPRHMPARYAHYARGVVPAYTTLGFSPGEAATRVLRESATCES